MNAATKCQSCKGTGEHRYRDSQPIASDIYTCPKCKGTGVEPPSRPHEVELADLLAEYAPDVQKLREAAFAYLGVLETGREIRWCEEHDRQPQLCVLAAKRTAFPADDCRIKVRLLSEMF